MGVKLLDVCTLVGSVAVGHHHIKLQDYIGQSQQAVAQRYKSSNHCVKLLVAIDGEAQPLSKLVYLFYLRWDAETFH